MLFDEEQTLRGKPGESRNTLLARWEKAHGKAEVLLRIEGLWRPSELARHIAALQRQQGSQSGYAQKPSETEPQENSK